MSEAVHGEVNHIIFWYGLTDETVAAEVPVLTEDGFRRAWRTVFRIHRMPAESVHRIMSDWAATASDEAFIARNFPNLEERTAIFERPGPDGWEEAIAHALVVREAAERQVRQDALDALRPSAARSI